MKIRSACGQQDTAIRKHGPQPRAGGEQWASSVSDHRVLPFKCHLPVPAVSEIISWRNCTQTSPSSCRSA